MRYKNIPILKKDGSPRYYRTTLLPKIEESDTDVVIISKSGDRFDLLANDFYNDVNLWWVIAHANKSLPQNMSFSIPGGLNIRIPQNITKIFSDLKKLNGVI